MEKPPTQETESKPAPGNLAYVQAFVNTYDLESGRDKLASPDLLRTWLAEHNMLGQDESVSESDHRQALDVREALRNLLLVNSGMPLDPSAVALLNRAAADAPLEVRFDEKGNAQLEPRARDAAGATATLLGIVYRAKAEGTWERLKACLSDTCHWAFYDASKNRSGSWCTMAVCGSRMKARAYRQRKSGEESKAATERS